MSDLEALLEQMQLNRKLPIDRISLRLLAMDFDALMNGIKAVIALHAPYEAKWKDKPLVCSECQEDDRAGGAENVLHPCLTLKILTKALGLKNE